MTNAEAAVWLYRLKNSIKGKFEADLEISVALDMTIDALKKDGDVSGREDIRKIKEFIRNECYYLINIREQVCELRNEIERRTRENDDLYYTLADTIGLYREYRVQYQSEFHILSAMCHILGDDYFGILTEILDKSTL